jgi:hypothetical protein
MEKPRDQWDKRYYRKHKKRVLARNRIWRRNNKKRRAELQWRYRGIDLTYSKYLSELKKQKGKCKICGDKMKRPNVDHDHKTGLYRGLLCIPCNVGLGVYERKKNLFKKYLERT